MVKVNDSINSNDDKTKKTNKSPKKSPKNSPKSLSPSTHIHRIYSCAELESKVNIKKIKTNKMEMSLKRVDSSVLAFHSSKNILTKYNCTELKAIQDSKLAQAPPQCLYDPNIIRLNILKYSGQHPDGYDDECKSFREKLHNLSLSSWDPKFLELLNNYHNSLLYPGIVNNNQSRTDGNLPRPRPETERHVSWVDQKAIIDNRFEKFPTYNKKLNFFDNITTTTNHRPPRGVGMFNGRNDYVAKQQQQQQRPFVRNAKGNPCAQERYQHHQSFGGESQGSSSLSSSGGSSLMFSSIHSERSKDDSFATDEHKSSKTDEETEPEWFSCPVSRQDMIDLHGFEDEDPHHGSLPKSSDDNLTSKAGGQSRPHSSQGRPHSSQEMNFDNFMKYHSVSQESAQYRKNNYPQSNQYQAPRFNKTYNNNPNWFNQRSTNSRYTENPLHSQPTETSPFFEMWKRKNGSNNNENINFMNLMNNPNSMRNMGNDMKHDNAKNNMYNMFSNHPAPDVKNVFQAFEQASSSLEPQTFPQFIQNGVASTSNSAIWDKFNNHNNAPIQPRPNRNQTMPTPEQLQHHTNEIMKNALIRKQFFDSRKYQ